MKIAFFGTTLALNEIKKLGTKLNDLGYSQDEISLVSDLEELKKQDLPVCMVPHLPKSQWQVVKHIPNNSSFSSRSRELSLWRDRLETHLLAESCGLKSSVMLMQAFGSWEELLALAQKSSISEWNLMSLHPCGVMQLRSFVLKGYEVYPGQIKDRFNIWLENIRLLSQDTFYLLRRSMSSMRRVRVPYFVNRSGEIQFLNELDCSLSHNGQRVLETTHTGWIDPLSLNREQWTQFLKKSQAKGFGHLDFLSDGNRFFFENWHPFPTWSTVFSLESSSNNSFYDFIKAQLTDELAFVPSRNIRTQIFITNREPNKGLASTGVLNQVFNRDQEDIDLTQKSYLNDQNKFIEGETELIKVSSSNTTSFKESLKQLQYSLNKLVVLGSIETSYAFVRDLLRHPWIQEGMFHEAFLEDEFIPQLIPPPKWITWLKQQIKESQIQEGWVKVDAEKGDPPFCHIFLDPVVKDTIWCNVSGWTFKYRLKTQSDSVKELKSLVPGRVYAIWNQIGEAIVPGKPVFLIESHFELVPHAISQRGYSLGKICVQQNDEIRVSQCLAKVTVSV